MVSLIDTILTTILQLLSNFGNMRIPIFSNSNQQSITLFNLLLIMGVFVAVLDVFRRLAK